MDGLTFIAMIVKALAWPAVVVAFGVMLREQLKSLVTKLAARIAKFKGPGGFEATFSQEVDAVEATLPSDEREKIEEAPRQPQVAEVASLPPAYIVSNAWLTVENALREALNVSPENSLANPTALIINAKSSNLITMPEYFSLVDLRKLRNRVVHEERPEITLTDALRFRDIANALAENIRQRTGKGTPPKASNAA